MHINLNKKSITIPKCTCCLATPPPPAPAFDIDFCVLLVLFDVLAFSFSMEVVAAF